MNKDLYYFALMVTPSKVAFILIFVEMAIFITYYKDVIFAMTTLTNFCGMYYTSQNKLPEADRHWFFNQNKSTRQLILSKNDLEDPSTTVHCTKHYRINHD